MLRCPHVGLLEAILFRNIGAQDRVEIAAWSCDIYIVMQPSSSFLSAWDGTVFFYVRCLKPKPVTGLHRFHAQLGLEDGALMSRTVGN